MNGRHRVRALLLARRRANNMYQVPGTGQAASATIYQQTFMRKPRTVRALLCLGAATTTAVVSGFHTCGVSRSRSPRWQPRRSSGREVPAKGWRQGDSSSGGSGGGGGRVGPSLWRAPTVRCAPLPAGDDNYVSAAARWGTPECVGARPNTLSLPCLKGITFP